MMLFPNEMNESYAEEKEDNIFFHTLIKWNYHEMIADHFMVVYWLKCILKPGCLKIKLMHLPMEPLDGTNGINISRRRFEDSI